MQATHARPVLPGLAANQAARSSLGSGQPHAACLQLWRGAQLRSSTAGSNSCGDHRRSGRTTPVAAAFRAVSNGEWSASSGEGSEALVGGSPHIVPFRSGDARPALLTAAPSAEDLEVVRERSTPSWPSAAARRGLYSDVPVDRVDSLHATVVGKLPSWLKGSFYRNGPGKFAGAHAVFDGLAMIVRFRLDGSANEAVLSHRFLDSVYYKAARSQGSIHWKMAHPPGGGARHALKGLAYAGGLALGALYWGAMGDNAVISIVPHGNELIAHTETLAGTYRVHPETLETLGRVHYRDDLHGLVKTAHLSRLPCGDLIGLAADFAPVLDGATGHLQLPELTVFRQSPWQSDKRHKVAAVPYLRPTAPTWVHEVPVSERYAVVVQNPVQYNIRAMLLGQTGEYMVFDWRPEDGSLLHVVPLLGGEVKSFRAPAFLAAHWVNAFESADGRFLHLDAAVADSPALMSHWALERVRAGPGGPEMVPSCLRRLTIDLSQPDGTVLQEPLLQPLASDEATGRAFELPSINPTCRGRPYHFAYGACCVRPTNCWNALCKVDTHSGEVRTWHEPGGATWEPFFVPRPGGRAEDDGVVMSTIMQADGRSALLVLDARTWKEVARAVLPYSLPNGFHACWVPS